MNRIVLIGNGFDLAHNLPTKYENFINWYWDQWLYKLKGTPLNVLHDELCKYEIINNVWTTYLHINSGLTGVELINEMRKVPTRFKYEPSKLLERITKSIVTTGWVDIENEYYKLLIEIINIPNKYNLTINTLNSQLKFLQEKLIEFLRILKIDNNNTIDSLMEMIYAPFQKKDISIKDQNKLNDHFEFWMKQNEAAWSQKLYQFNISDYHVNISAHQVISDINKFKERYNKILEDKFDLNIYREYKYFMLPDNILILNFNYTETAELYLYHKKNNITRINYIHGKLCNPESIIFGYGDELDDEYIEIKKLNNNEFLRHFKTAKYLESDNYRNLLQFIDSAPFQLCIMGHSCGNSDRTLLNTLFEHDNCVSIKPYYYQKDDGSDDYLDKIQNISRNFTDMKKMRDRVVNKTYCEPLPQLKQ